MSMIAKNRIKSSWTPLSNEDTNNKVNRNVAGARSCFVCLMQEWFFLHIYRVDISLCKSIYWSDVVTTGIFNAVYTWIYFACYLYFVDFWREIFIVGKMGMCICINIYEVVALFDISVSNIISTYISRLGLPFWKC